MINIEVPYTCSVIVGQIWFQTKRQRRRNVIKYYTASKFIKANEASSDEDDYKIISQPEYDPDQNFTLFLK